MSDIRFRLLLFVALLTGSIMLAGCGSSSTAPVTDRSLGPGQAGPPGPPPRFGRYYTVRKGDTLYSIAWAIKQDYRKLAAWNGIRSPYTIYVGQRLKLFPTGTTTTRTAPVRPATNKAPVKSAPRQTTTASTSTSTSTRTKPRPVPATSSTRGGRTAASGSHYLGPVKQWRWPTSSRKVHARFSPASGRLGIDITGRKGDSVYAAADGQVVYAGSGLRGYGKLIIVKHNNTYLSAYAHNSRMLVTEGQYVKGGQKIAEMGHGGSGRYKLHFEIRKKGKPVNPLTYLPKG